MAQQHQQQQNEQDANSSSPNAFTSAANNALWSLQGGHHGSYGGTGPQPQMPTSSPASIPHNLFSSPALHPTSVVNLSNSSDVVIGPMTQYQGAVTIYQYMDATNTSMRANGGIAQSRHSTSNNISQRLTTTSKLLITLIVLVLIAVAVVVYLELRAKATPVRRPPIVFDNNYEDGTFPNLGNGHLVIDRLQWGASELAQVPPIPLTHPIPYVLITHIGVQSRPCNNIYKCSIKMRTIQDAAVAEKNLTDIQGNFYVADDGNVYVGRGWHYANTYANGTLAVTFMGDYGRYVPTEAQLEATQYLLAYALTNKYLALDYKLVAHNQTRKSKSPGANVYREIKKWPHFYPCGMDDKPRCGSELGMPDVWDADQ